MKKRLASASILTLIASALVVAAPHRQTTARPQQAPPIAGTGEIANLRKQIADLSKRLDGYEELLNGVAETSSDGYLKAIELRHETATLSPTSLAKYSRVDSDQASFLISLDNVVPYLEGFRLTVNVGNLSAADFPGFTLRAEWGPKFDRTRETAALWLAKKRKDTFTFTSTLRSGAWNRVEVILPNTDSAHFDYLTLGISTNTVALNR